MQYTRLTATSDLHADKHSSDYGYWKDMVMAQLMRAGINPDDTLHSQYNMLYQWGYTVLAAADKIALETTIA